MKTTLVILTFCLSIFYENIEAQDNSIHQFKVKKIDGTELDMKTLAGKKILIVNTASKCGFTPQYADLEKLYKKYGNNSFIILGFPANNFREQEPGTNEQIMEFCQINYGVTFPMMEKISVKGDDMAPIYQWLTKKENNGVMDSDVKWNFQKYMIDETGKLVDMVGSAKSPFSDKIIKWIENK